MKNKIKISFLVAAHNEEKVIARCIKNLLSLPSQEYEIIIGLDGCTDKTLDIVKKFSKNKKLKYFKLNLRQGKHAVINNIIKKASGEIIVINDADWIFKVKNKQLFDKFFSVFNDFKVGGIAESFPINYPIDKKSSLLNIGLALQNLVWIDYLKARGKKINKDWIIADKNSFPLLVNIFRKNLHKDNSSVGDDFERFINIILQNKQILATNNLNLPRMISVGEKYTVKNVLSQKERTAIARKQLSSQTAGKKIISLPFIFFTIKKSLGLSLKEFFAFYFVNFLFLLGAIKSKFKKNISTKEAWKMRVSRA